MTVNPATKRTPMHRLRAVVTWRRLEGLFHWEARLECGHRKRVTQATRPDAEHVQCLECR
jgi:hypothetical protein